jgi:hypothetical protein
MVIYEKGKVKVTLDPPEYYWRHFQVYVGESCVYSSYIKKEESITAEEALKKAKNYIQAQLRRNRGDLCAYQDRLVTWLQHYPNRKACDSWIADAIKNFVRNIEKAEKDLEALTS